MEMLNCKGSVVHSSGKKNKRTVKISFLQQTKLVVLRWPTFLIQFDLVSSTEPPVETRVPILRASYAIVI